MIETINCIDKKLSHRNNFFWGIGIHSSYYSSAYKASNLEKNIHLAASMGMKLIRTNANSPQDELDKTVRLCNAYGMQIMLVIYIPDFSVKKSENLSKIEEKFYFYANRYNGKNGFGKVDFIQLHNEMDLAIMNANPNGGSDGDRAEDWIEEHLANVTEQVKAAVAGVRAADTDAKTVINHCWLHYGMLDYFYTHGVEWDIIGHDWYADMMNAYETRYNSTAYGIGELLYQKYGKKIIICESNYFNFDISSNASWDDAKAETYDILIRGMEDAYRQDYVVGFTFYELIDELQFEKPEWQRGDNTWNREAHFGMVFADREGNIGDVKPVYNRIKGIIGGEDVPYIRNVES